MAVAGCATEDDRVATSSAVIADSGSVEAAPVMGASTGPVVAVETGRVGGGGVGLSGDSAGELWRRVQGVLSGRAGASDALFEALGAADPGRLRSARYEVIPDADVAWYPEAALWLSDAFTVSGFDVRLEPEGLRALDRWILEQAGRRDPSGMVLALDGLDQLLAGLMIDTSALTGGMFEGGPYLYIAALAWRLQVLSRMAECGPLGETVARPRIDGLTSIRRGERGLEEVP